jgi:hypothetical protein
MTETTHTSDTRSEISETPGACCGGPAPKGADACCARDAAVKSTGGSGCGCGSPSPPAAAGPAKTGCCG